MVLLTRPSFTRKIPVEFRRTVAVGATMETETRVLDVRDSREAMLEGILTHAGGQVCAASEGTFRIFSPAVAKRLKIVDDKMLAWCHDLLAIPRHA